MPSAPIPIFRSLQCPTPGRRLSVGDLFTIFDNGTVVVKNATVLASQAQDSYDHSDDSGFLYLNITSSLQFANSTHYPASYISDYLSWATVPHRTCAHLTGIRSDLLLLLLPIIYTLCFYLQGHLQIYSTYMELNSAPFFSCCLLYIDYALSPRTSQIYSMYMELNHHVTSTK